MSSVATSSVPDMMLSELSSILRLLRLDFFLFDSSAFSPLCDESSDSASLLSPSLSRSLSSDEEEPMSSFCSASLRLIREPS